jgi:hypothetical protein
LLLRISQFQSREDNKVASNSRFLGKCLAITLGGGEQLVGFLVRYPDGREVP